MYHNCYGGLVTKSCLTGSSVYGILQARILEWLAISHKFTCWSPNNPKYFRMWLCWEMVFKETIRALIQDDWYTRYKNIRTKRYGWPFTSQRERAQKKPQDCWHLDLRLLVSSFWEKKPPQSAGLCYSTHTKLMQQSVRLSASTGLILDNALYSPTGNYSYKSSHRMPLCSWSNSWLQQHFLKCRFCYLRWVSALRGQALPRLSKAPSRDSSWSSFSFSFSSSFLVVRTPMLSGEF